MKLNRRDLRSLIESVINEEGSKLKKLIQKIRKGKGVAKAVNPETGEDVEPKQAVSALERMENLVNEMPDKRALGFVTFGSMNQVQIARSMATKNARKALARKISSETSKGVTVSQARLQSPLIADALIQDQSTGKYTYYVVLEIQ